MELLFVFTFFRYKFTKTVVDITPKRVVFSRVPSHAIILNNFNYCRLLYYSHRSCCYVDSDG